MQQEKKKLNMFNIYCMGVGGAIGSGIFVMLGMGIGLTGHSIVLTVGLGCIYMLLAYFYHPIMSSMFVLPGGNYDMTAMLCGPVFTGLNGIFTYVAGFSMAMYAVAIVDYVSMIFPGIIAYRKLVGVLIVILAFAATVKGSKFVANVTSLMTAVLLGSIALFVILGVPKVQPGFFNGDTFFLGGFGGFIQSISVMSWACQGTTMAPISMMEVTKKPRKTIPIGIMFITITVGIVYALIGFVASGVLPVEEVAGKNLTVVASEIFPNWLYMVFVLGGAVFAIGTSLMGAIGILRYPCYRVAEDGWMPSVFVKTTKDGYPYVVNGFFFILCIIPILFDFSLDELVSLAMVPSMLMSMYMNLSLIRLVKKYPEQWKQSVLHMPTPVFNVACVIASACAGVVAVQLLMMLKPMEMVFCVGLLAVCLGYSWMRIKTGAVSREFLKKKRDDIAAAALAATANDHD